MPQLQPDPPTAKTVPPFDHDAISGVTLDLVEVRKEGVERPDTGPGTLPAPDRIFLNGKEWWAPDDAKFTVGIQGPGASVVEVTMTFLARRVRVGFADELLQDN